MMAELWSELSQLPLQIQAALITGTCTFLGALIGFSGLLYLARRSDRITRQHFIYSRNRERREEVLSEVYGLLDEMQSNFLFFLNPQFKNEREDWSEKYGKSYTRIANYVTKNLIWIPQTIEEAIRKFTNELDTLNDEANNLRNNSTAEEYELRRVEIFKRAQTLSPERTSQIWALILKYLEIPPD